jgi:hypothetical protein
MFHFLLAPYNGPTKANYQHCCVVFGEGLKARGVPFSANIDYFPDMSGNYLFQAAKPAPNAFIVTSAPEDFTDELNTTHRIIVFDAKDEWVRPKSTQFVPQVYRYFITTCVSTSNVMRPHCFAASNRMLRATAEPPAPWSQRSREIAWTHRVDNHYLRNLVKSFYDNSRIKYDTYLDKFAEPSQEALHDWSHTGRRHSPAYFKFLRTHRYMDAHGGYPTQTRNRIVQWDSWKVWEGFLSGMLVITADLDYYNIQLPFKLIPFVHYIPVRYHELENCYKDLFSLPDAEQEAIAMAGRDYVRDHYNPESIAAYITVSL